MGPILSKTVMAPVDNPENKDPWVLPQLDFRVEDLSHPGAKLFFRQIPNPYDAIKRAVEASWKWLYGWNESSDIQHGKNSQMPVVTPPLAVRRVKRITLTIRPMDGVAYTFGSDDGSKKEVHFSLNHIVNSHKGDTEIKKDIRVREEILGVLVHEIVHCYQYNGQGTAPGGLIEGIADCVRLHEKLSPPHWKRAPPKGKHVPEPDGKWVWDWNWDAGYERTAYFLDWIDTTSETWPNSPYTRQKETDPNAMSSTRLAPPPSASSIPIQISPPSLAPSPPLGKGLFFRALNARLKDAKWSSEMDLFLEITNWPRDALWEAYCAGN
ncbi:peptidase of plants and bacteria-domain-containing protein [Lentinula boryana]|uniref:Peptidase of plants and bacteria-domain-containing protein n=1 Tax=Lentinula boryana TaxID=40481 RepID=A0ABQ8QUQ1_9AGAR|nr:peptidase of plants and bacteria-domain-containing protein [Lentinula boryana]